MNRSSRRVLGLLTALALGLSACVEQLLPQPSARGGVIELPPDMLPTLRDDSNLASLLACVRQSLDQLGRLPPERAYESAAGRITVAELQNTLAVFQEAVLAAAKPVDWPALLDGRFRVLRATPPGGVLFTGYFQPELPASRERTDRYRYPVYRVPEDLVQFDPSAYCPHCDAATVVGRVKDHALVPYYSRAEIDGSGALDGQEAELAWLDDPIEVFFLHVQGSGLLRFDDGSAMQIGFAGSNGRDYKSIGKLLVEAGKVPLESASLQTLRDYLQQHPEERDALLFANERYIFFRPVPVGPIGSLGVPLTPGRSVAVDPGAYPLGSLAFIHTERTGESRAVVPLERFVCAQDAGAAITGPGRVDVYWGGGPEAERIAGPMRSAGEMYLLLAQ